MLFSHIYEELLSVYKDDKHFYFLIKEMEHCLSLGSEELTKATKKAIKKLIDEEDVDFFEDDSADGQNIFHFCARNNFKHVIEAFVDIGYGKLLNKIDKSNSSALNVAVCYCNYDAANTLVDLGANLSDPWPLITLQEEMTMDPYDSDARREEKQENFKEAAMLVLKIAMKLRTQVEMLEQLAKTKQGE